MQKLLSFGHWIVIFSVILSAGCKSTSTTEHESHPSKSKNAQSQKYIPTERDSAPAGPVPHKFKKVIPKNEPISRYGNPAAYRVDGRQYEVMTTASGYRQRGTASWYGTKFHSRRTSSGEHYDMYALTAAHKTLPLPTYIRVKNLKNGRVAIVKVNDRGPFHSNRILDLSYGAAAKLGIFPEGTAPVEIEALSVKGKSPVAHYYLQTGAFSSSQLAEQLKAKLQKISSSPVFIQKDNNHRFLVRVGPFANRQMSENLKSKLAHLGVSGAFSLLL